MEESSSLVSKATNLGNASKQPRRPIYQPLDSGDFEIRILTILPDEPDAPIRCRLDKVSLVRPGIYTSLSYCWGDPHPSAQVSVNGWIMPVGLNLNHALQDLRSLGVSRVWADALCINQGDRQDRSLQVRLMRQIYSKAERVISWIGPSTADLTTAMDIIKMYKTSLEKGSFFDQYENENTFIALEAFFQRSYWKRVWIIQEIAVARSVTILCGTYEMSWADLESVGTLVSALNWPSEQPYRLPSYGFVRGVLDLCKTYRQSNLCVPPPYVSPSEPRSINLCYAIAKTQNALASDPRDKIYALLGICQDGEALVAIPNYQQPFEETLRDLTRSIMRKHATLDFLLWKPSQMATRNEDLPSWVLQLSDVPYDAVAFLNSSERGIDVSLDKLNSDEAEAEATLKMTGLIVGSVKSMTSNAGTTPAKSSVPASGQDPKMVTDHTTKYYGGDCQLVSEALWEVLSLSRHNSNSDIQVFTEQFSDLWTGPGQMNILFGVGWDSYEPNPVTGYVSLDRKLGIWTKGRIYPLLYARSSTMIPFKDIEAWFQRNAAFTIGDKSLQDWTGRASIWKRLTTFKRPRSRRSAQIRLMKAISGSIMAGLQLIITDRGALGIAHPKTRVGDKVCFAKACSVPLILREVKYQGRTAYKVIGAAHVCLSMDDERKVKNIDRAEILELI